MEPIYNIEKLKERLLYLSQLSAEGIDELILKGEYIICSGLSFDNLDLPTLPDGWNIVVTLATKKLNLRSIIILPSNPDKNVVWNKGLVEYIKTTELPTELQELWLSSKNKNKYNLISLITKLYNDVELRSKYLEYNPDWTIEEFREWALANNSYDKLSPKKRLELIELMKEFKLV